MSNKSFLMPDALYEYLLSSSLREPELLARLREETARDPMARMQIAPEQGQFMALLVALMGARMALEIGVYTGYSSLCVARALGPQGRLIACDISDQWTSIARRYWDEAGLGERIELRLAPALETLDALLREGYGGSLDFAFIDADKGNYYNYYLKVLELLRPGGLICIDNVLWSGKVAASGPQDADTEAIREFNRRLQADENISLSMVPVADGLTLAMKRP